ncbi:type III secretion chaperone SycN [Yersinia enterocolitica]|uniref:type III secretion chaperone SycN n=1 Tax=Yersinia enterocolitica TaxID=630 RepID=UPI00065A822A|nr:type III secretion chaperone SycN [Yersinia enterocolitica]CRY33046.1 YopN chaperone SycN [Yersinia enterocolitica]HDQ4768871.1 type III secretion chaperone SycN [Yersinia enterocolitica]
MSWIEPIISHFCQDLGVPTSSPLSPLIQLEMAQSGTLQLEQYGATLTLWLARSLAWHRCEDAMVKALTLTAAQKSGALPLRAGWLGESQLVLFVSLDERSLTLPLLHQAFEQLLRLQQEVLAP